MREPQEITRQLVQRLVVEQHIEARVAQIQDRLLRRRLRGPVGERPHCGAQERRSERGCFEVGGESHGRRHVRVHLERQVRRRTAQRRHERAHPVGGQQAARVLEVENVDMRTSRDRTGALCVVVVRVERADREHEPGDNLFRAAPLRDRGDLQIGCDIVHRLGDPDAPDPVADHAVECEFHHLLGCAPPGHETHTRCDETEPRLRHQFTDDADPLPRVLAVPTDSHRHVRRAREVDRVKPDAIQDRRDLGEHRRREGVRTPEALVPVADGGVDKTDLSHRRRCGRARRRTAPARRSERRPRRRRRRPPRSPRSSASSPR